MRLEDGKLYETKRGWRFRVKEDKADGTFTCTSFGGFWDMSGRAFCKVWHDGQYKKPHLVKEVEATRLISVTSDAKWDERDEDFRHFFKRVTKEEAQRIGHEGNRLGEGRKSSAILQRVIARLDDTPAKVGRPAKSNKKDVRWVTVAQLQRWSKAMVEGQSDYMAAYREILKALEEPADSTD